MTDLGQLLREKLNQGTEAEQPFSSVSRSFYNVVADFLRDQDVVVLTFAEWSDVRGTAKADRVVEAIKMLREMTTSSYYVKKVLPSGMKDSAFGDYVKQRAGSLKQVRKIGLRDAKHIIDLVRENETFFDDTEE